MSSFFLLKWGVQIRYLFNQNQTPHSDSANLEPSEPILCPQILEPRRVPAAGGWPSLVARNISTDGCVLLVIRPAAANG